MSINKSPGVYIQEVVKLSPSVAEVETAIPAFIGYTEKVTDKITNDLLLTPKRITSLLDYERYFGGPYPERFGVEVSDVFKYTAEITTPTLIPEVKTMVSRTMKFVTPPAVAAVSTGANRNTAIPPGFSKFKLYYHLQMYFANGGGPCYIVSIGPYATTTAGSGFTMYSVTTPAKLDYSKGLKAIEQFDEPTLLLLPEAAASLSNADYYALIKDCLAQCNKLMDRFSVFDVTGTADAMLDDFRTGTGNNFLKYGSAYYPNLNTNLNYGSNMDSVKVTLHTRQILQNDGTLVSAPVDTTTPALTAGPFLQSEDLTKQGSLNAIDDQIIKDFALAEIRKIYINNLPPSSSIVGVYAQVDGDRGVWKAPANASLSYVTGLTVSEDGTLITIDDDAQDGLNVDPVAGKSINAIRNFTGKGIMVWGARTLAGNDNEWRYVPVRRFFNFVEESCKKSTSWAVFEPNDANTWLRIKGQIDNFLYRQWTAGALQGSKPDNAYYVKVGLGITMTDQDVLEGRMIVEIGMAVVRPAEFIILKFSHMLAKS